MSHPRNRDGLCLLSLDGGGVRGLSALLILKKLMESVAEDPENPPKPCEYFDMIGGTSTGGLIAIMLGRLSMTVDECIAEYKKLSSKIFTKVHRMKVGVRFQGLPDIVLKNRFNHAAIEDGVKDLLKRKKFDPDVLFKEIKPQCYTFVCATSGETSETVQLSNYYSPRRGNDLRNVAKIWEVARATSAASGFFDSMEIGGEIFRDGGTGANNPIFQVWDEAVDIYKPAESGFSVSDWKLEDHLKCIVSIGTGKSLLHAFGDSVKDIGQALVAISTNSTLAANNFRQRHTELFQSPSRIAFRFDVTQGLEEIGLEKAEKIPAIEATTRRYISSEDVFREIELCANILRIASWVDAIISELVRWFPGLSKSVSMSKDAESEMDKPLSFLPHTEAYHDWKRNGGLLSCEHGPSDHVSRNIAAGTVQFTTDNEPRFRRISVLYFSCPDSWTSGAQVGRSKMGRRRLADVFATLLVQTLYIIKQSGRGTNSQLHDALSNLTVFGQDRRRTLDSEDVLNAVKVGRWQTCAAIFIEVFRTIDQPFLVAIDNVQFLGEEAESLALAIQTWCSTKRISIAAIIGGCDITVGDKLSGYKARDDTEYLECLQSLYTLRHRMRRDEIASPAKGTLDWLWTHPSYVEWSRAISAVLWIQGKPGSGKSVLAKSIVESKLSEVSVSTGFPAIAQRNTVICDWYYSTRGGEELMAHSSLMRSLLHQLLHQNPMAFDFVKQWYRQTAPLSSEWAQLYVMQKVLVEAAKAGIQMMCVIDAMDESQHGDAPSEDRLGMLDHFSTLVSEITASQVKFIILSRPYPDIEDHFYYHRMLFDNLYTITLEKENSAAILQVIELGLLDLQQAMHPRIGAARGMLRRAKERGVDISSLNIVNHLPMPREEEHLKKIKEYLITNAGGVILWVSLILSTLKSLVSSGIFTLLNLQDTLKTLPLDLIDLYRHIIKGVIGDHDQKRVSLARKALMLVTGANVYGPLTISELHEALAIPDYDSNSGTDEVFELIEDQKFPIMDGDWNELRTRLRLLCGPLIEVIKAPKSVSFFGKELDDNDDGVEASDRVQLLHRTTKDILANHREAQELHFTETEAAEFVCEVMNHYQKIVFPRHRGNLSLDKVGLLHQTSDCNEIPFLNIPSLVSFLEARTFLSFCIRNTNLTDMPLESKFGENQESANLKFLSKILIDRFNVTSESVKRQRKSFFSLYVNENTKKRENDKDIICSEYIQSACRNGLSMTASLLLRIIFEPLSTTAQSRIFLGSVIRGLPSIAKELRLKDQEIRLKETLLVIRQYSAPLRLNVRSEILPWGVKDEAKDNIQFKRSTFDVADVLVRVVTGDQSVIHGPPQPSKVSAAISEVLSEVHGYIVTKLVSEAEGMESRLNKKQSA